MNKILLQLTNGAAKRYRQAESSGTPPFVSLRLQLGYIACHEFRQHAFNTQELSVDSEMQ
jgi:hypothetical protein